MPASLTWQSVVAPALYIQRHEIHALRLAFFDEEPFSDRIAKEVVGILRTFDAHAGDKRVDA